MQLTVKRGNLVLADGADWAVGKLTGELPLGVTRLMEVLPLLGAGGVSAFDYVTRSLELEFQITRVHEDESAALLFAGTHDALATGRADLRLQWSASGVSYTLKSQAGAWKATTSSPSGCGTDTTYRFEGKPFTATSTAGPVGEYVDGGDGYDQEYGPIPGVLDGGHYRDTGVPAVCAVHAPTY